MIGKIKRHKYWLGN